MLPEEDIDNQAEIETQENVLVWTNSISKPIPEFETKRRRPPEKHPLLKLLEEENDLKHCDYTAHLLIQRQAREYAFAVEDVLRVLKQGTDCVNACKAVWRGDHSKKWPFSSKTDRPELEAEGELTEVGRKILTISESVKILQEEDPLAFWTSQQRVSVLQQLVSFVKEAVKFRRKLLRIKGSLEDRVRNVRRVAIQCECEITGNLVPSEIYYQWVKEDSTLYKDSNCMTASVSLHNVSKDHKKVSSAIKKTALNLVACIKADGSTDSMLETESESSLISHSGTLNMSTIPTVYQMDKSIEVLHEMSAVSGQEDEESVCELDLKNETCTLSDPTTHIDVNGAATSQIAQLEDVWVPKPSQKYLETIASNVAPPQKFNTREYIYDHCESRIKEVSEGPCSKCALEDEMNNRNDFLSLSSNYNAHESQAGPQSVRMAMHQLIRKSSRDNMPSTSGISTPPSVAVKLLSDSMEQQISLIVNARNAMHEIVTQTSNTIRRMEREWVSPETMIKSKASGREFYDLVDFIVATARLTEDPAFATRLYPEDKHEIVSVLDPVLRELTNCFMSLHTLHNLVAVDVQYLKELVTGFPKGSLIIRDWVSDPSIDEELAEIEQPTAVTDCDFDVDELFD